MLLDQVINDIRNGYQGEKTVPNASELQRAEEERLTDQRIDARLALTIWNDLTPGIRAEIAKLAKAHADDTYAKELQAAAHRRRDLNGN